ncbi:MAG TPA: uracil-DNA glycosylase [Thermodesulfobacteriota bacterium]|nr:uracil-DNA glycosylase [Thermodesulfobacteriota bacterium]
METKTSKAVCVRCRHFYVTWDEFFPKGCKAMSFKSREAPSKVVLDSSGIECQKFEPKRAGKDG